MKIAVVGIGYVGLSNAVLLSQNHEVFMLDIDHKKVEKINNKENVIQDDLIEEYLKYKPLNIQAHTNQEIVYKNTDYIIIATPTNYNEDLNHFDTSSIEEVISSALKINPSATIIIKSTIPIGYTEKIKKQFNYESIIFCPEFLREGKALYDNLHPSRIIVGEKSSRGLKIAKLFQENALKKDISVYLTNPTEAESIKLFSNTYLAMRIGFFNEIDTYARKHGLDTKDIIMGVSADPRIGNYYNNPSFGYGGYCLPKDTKQLLQNFKDTPNNLIKAIVKTNETRKIFIKDTILSLKQKKIGIYRLIMKKDSDNFRNSVMLDIVKYLKNHNADIIVYEPLLNDETDEFSIENNFEHFMESCDIIIANRIDDKIRNYKYKIFTADVFECDF
ncbi:nucleotide sugar dehydrogenase [Campylobacter lari]|uniref:nucleotide sugar dehydrogenase n=1 Tax=Campylobacter lari TaxID=201 RepID=UPI00057C4CB3|nr:nucleotide sugar dehydrogenase [Campylobacter lari]AJC89594.1 UDP-glucose 6-dehydrogenase [Campylobacter lari subsp. concheus LMG 11760]EAJ0335418.1 nucleotide sugar dehydrogenase [Campylobacter lari]EAJ1276702.1 nucleotide sugar dehydrogenase [Campylobacter lari]EAK9998430.1 nucleotide sugar dehydrogenase [Campylobacter lari]